MGTNLQEFTLGVQQAAKEIHPAHGVTKLQRAIVFEVFRRIVLRTPVRSGRARGNWQVNFGTPATGIVEGQWNVTPGRPTPASDDQMAMVASKTSGIPPFGIVWISNNLPYIERLEEGYSTQTPPAGMVTLSVEEMRFIFP